MGGEGAPRVDVVLARSMDTSYVADICGGGVCSGKGTGLGNSMIPC